MEDILELIFKRRSIRIYDRKKLDKETITKLMQAAMAQTQIRQLQCPSCSRGVRQCGDRPE